MIDLNLLDYALSRLWRRYNAYNLTNNSPVKKFKRAEIRFLIDEILKEKKKMISTCHDSEIYIVYTENGGFYHCSKCDQTCQAKIVPDKSDLKKDPND